VKRPTNPGPDRPAVAPAFAGRTGAAKRELLKGGSSPQAEVAVAAGLAWLVKQQQADGHWSLGNKMDQAFPGHMSEEVAGSALGLLPLLGAGHTHKGPADSPFNRSVAHGLEYLLQNQKPDGRFANYLYSHALAATAVCEAYGMTADPRLKGPAQRALNFIASAQTTAGSWGYTPDSSPGDTSVTGFQVMALATGRAAGLEVPAKTLEGVVKWLDFCGTADGSGYGYRGPPVPKSPLVGAATVTPSMTAVGLLCRLQLGWGPRHPGLKAGVQRLQAAPPESYAKNVYVAYYAAPVMYHAGGDAWRKWNPRLRDALIARQDPDGSWSPPADPPASAYGRLVNTSLALLTLEVYYRHLPLSGGGPGGKKEP
jgi:hypothetical protein